MIAPGKSSAAERFLRYVIYDTRSDEHSTSYPSTAAQLVLLERLVDELHAMGVTDATMDTYGYVMATIPATSARQDIPVIGFVAHVDTSPEVGGANVRPRVHQNYDGRDLVFPDAPEIALRVTDSPELRHQMGNDIITASGLTLLGADDKAGVAEIMAAAEHLVNHPEIAHGAVRIAFTPDEEIGRNAPLRCRRFGASMARSTEARRARELALPR